MKIEKNIEIPEDSGHAGRPLIYQWGKMEIGDSSFFDGCKSTNDSKQYSAAKSWGRNNNAKFVGRNEGDGVRVWRIS
jgi:hypothetical protein